MKRENLVLILALKLLMCKRQVDRLLKLSQFFGINLKPHISRQSIWSQWPNFWAGKESKKTLLQKKVPTLPNMKRGDFGEALMATLLSYFHEYQIPVPKLRFKIGGNQTLPATDFLALKIDKNNSIFEVCFVESKFRGSLDKYAAVTGYNQLQNDYSVRLPNILTFVAERLYERKDALYESFRSYMRNRKDTIDMDTFHLGLCWERDSWDESVLEKLEENGVNLDILTVSVVCIGGIRNLTDEIFKKFA